MTITLKDIAEQVGVSQMTVSRALRGVSRISPKTRQQIRDVAQQLGYQPIRGIVWSPVVRSGRGNHTLRILLPTIQHRVGAEGGSWWLDRMAASIRERLELSNGWLTEQHFPDLESLTDEWRRRRYHGIVLRQPLPDAWVRPLLKLGAVVYAVEFDHQCGVDSVYSNEHRSAATVLDYLTRLGHRQIAWLGILDHHAPYQVVVDADERTIASDRQAITVHGARHAAWANIVYCQLNGPRQPLVLINRDWRKQDLRASVREGLDRIMAMQPRPSAVVCSCDPVAVELMNQLHQRGVDVPRDVSIISYGGSPEVTEATPAITSVCMPMETIGQAIPELIERRLADPDAVPISMQFETKLFEGGSVADRRVA